VGECAGKGAHGTHGFRAQNREYRIDRREEVAELVDAGKGGDPVGGEREGNAPPETKPGMGRKSVNNAVSAIAVDDTTKGSRE
jgi:hypothetical protein